MSEKISKYFPRGFRREMYDGTMAAILILIFALSVTVIFGIWQNVVLQIPYIEVLGVTELPLATFKEYTTFFGAVTLGMFAMLVAMAYQKRGEL